jgi:peptide/nickel transport system substrate-binding protein
MQMRGIDPDTGVTRRRVLGAMAATAAMVAGCRSAVRGAPTAARRGGVVQIGQTNNVQLVSLLGQNAANLGLSRLVFNTLTQYDRATLQPRPSLATSWELTDSATTVTMRLRDDVRFHSGRPFTADDVIYSVHALLDPLHSSQLRTTATAIADVVADGAHQVTFRLRHPVSNLFDLFEVMFIVDRDSGEDLFRENHVIGTGPFVWKEHVVDEHVTLVRNPSYWRPGLPYLDGVEIRIIPDVQGLLASLEAGQSHLAIDLAPRDVVGLARRSAFRVTATDLEDAGYYVGCNVTVPPLDNRLVRQAIAWSVDRDRILRQVFDGIGRASSIPWSRTSPAFDRTLAGFYRHDPAKARQLVQQAGQLGAKVRLSVNGALPLLAEIGQIVQFNLREAGFAAELDLMPGATFAAAFAQRSLPGLWVNQHGFNQLHPPTLILGAVPFNAQRNVSNFVDQRYVDLANQAWNATTDAGARSAYRQVTQYLLDQSFVIELVVSSHVFTSSSKLVGYGYNGYDFLNLDQAHLSG